MATPVLIAGLLAAGFSDDFDDGTTGPQWTSFEGGGTVRERNAHLEIESVVASGSHYAGYFSAENWSFTGSQATVELISAGDISVNGWNVTFQVNQDASHLVMWLMEGGSAITEIDTPVNNQQTTSAPLSAEFRWLRIRESNGTTYWEHSADRQSWEISYSIANPVDLSSVKLQLSAGTYLRLSPARLAVFDNFELAPLPAGSGMGGGTGSDSSVRPVSLSTGCGCGTAAEQMTSLLAALWVLRASSSRRHKQRAG